MARQSVSGWMQASNDFDACWLISFRLLLSIVITIAITVTSAPSPPPQPPLGSSLQSPLASTVPQTSQLWLASPADMVGEKRKRSSAAHARSHSAVKRQSTTPAPPPTPPPTRPEIPTSFSKEEALPVLPERQPDNLPLKEYKSVAERFAHASSAVSQCFAEANYYRLQ